MTRNRPAPKGNRPAPSDATNVPASVGDIGLFEVRRQAYGGVAFEPAAYDDLAPATTGAQRRDAGHRRTAGTPDAAAYIDEGVRWIRRRISEGATELDAEQLRADLGEPTRTGAIGVIFRRCAQDRLIVPAGTRTASRPEAHSRDLRVWAPR